MKALAWFALLSTVALSAQTNSSWPGRHSWCVCGGTAHRTVVFENGRLYSQSWIDASNGRDLQKGLKPAEFSIKVGDEEVSSMSRGWSLITAHEQRTPDGSNQLELTLRRAPLEVNKVYVSFPGSSVIREWASFKNIGSASVTLSDPHFLDMTARLGDLSSIDLDWMTGGENRPGSWMLKTESLRAGRDRNFDSYDPFPGTTDSKFEFKMGSASYAPWFALYDRARQEGIVVGFDYFGRWASSFKPNADQSISMQLKVAGYHQALAPGASVTTPKAFTGIFRSDLDNAGNEVLDWQYQYLWDYTRAGWFPAIRMLGWWWNGTPWKDPGNTWVGGNGDAASAFRKVFRVSDLMSEVAQMSITVIGAGGTTRATGMDPTSERWATTCGSMTWGSLFMPSFILWTAAPRWRRSIRTGFSKTRWTCRTRQSFGSWRASWTNSQIGLDPSNGAMTARPPRRTAQMTLLCWDRTRGSARFSKHSSIGIPTTHFRV